jgi:hypothetical protein
MAPNCEKIFAEKHGAEIFPWACTGVERSADRNGKNPAHTAMRCPLGELGLPTGPKGVNQPSGAERRHRDRGRAMVI